MKVTIDKDAGFCFGVVRAINSAEKELLTGKTLHCIGDVVHNELENKRLSDLGLKKINSAEEVETERCNKVLIRAHGEPPNTYEILKKHNAEIVDATCPIVLQLQKNIKKAWKEMQKTGGKVIIFGEKNHAEVVGLNGQTDNNALIIERKSDLEKINFEQPLRVFSQTTKSAEAYEQLCQYIDEGTKRVQNQDVVFNNSICQSVSNRTKTLVQFSQQHDVIIFVSGKKSSNGHFLFGFCEKHNPKSYFVSVIEEIDFSWFNGVQSVGITGATSTPQWLMESIAHYIQNAIKC